MTATRQRKSRRRDKLVFAAMGFAIGVQIMTGAK
jgi:hypothetical protein